MKQIKIPEKTLHKENISLREKCPYSEFFWSVFSLIRTEYGEIRSTNVFEFVRISTNAGKYGPEKLKIWTLFTQCSLLDFAKD